MSVYSPNRSSDDSYFRNFYNFHSSKSYEVDLRGRLISVRANGNYLIRTALHYVQEVHIARFDDKPNVESVNVITSDGRARLILEDMSYGICNEVVEQIYSRLALLWNGVRS